MRQKYTTETFIEKSNKIHNNKYTYEKSIYKRTDEKVIITCKDHGDFNQRPGDHFSGVGCPLCGSTKKTTEQFVKESNKIHNNKYNYDKTNYKNNYTKVTITCLEHGDFEQIPHSHLDGLGCSLCSGMKKRTIEEFINQSSKKHNKKYDYSKSKYINNYTDIIITCLDHGDFEQNPFAHINGSGCPKCSGLYKPTTEEFIQKANIVHNNKYIYDKTIYTHSKIKIIITCKEHGDFEQEPCEHLRNRGCAKCAHEQTSIREKSNTEEFIQKANIIHKNKYDYDKVEYKLNKDKVIIICPKHGEFKQSPSDHLNKHGCLRCQKTYKQNKWLDLINIPDDNNHRFISLKINNKRIHPDGYDPTTKTIYEFYGDYWHGNPNIYNSNDINPVVKKTYGELYKKTIDRQNMIKNAGYNIVYIWESDFDKL